MHKVTHRLILPLGVGWETVAQLVTDWFQAPQQVDEHTYTLGGAATVRGPLPLKPDAPAWADSMIEVEVAANRGQPVPPALRTMGGIHQIYGDAEVIGFEREVLDSLFAAARYCAGAVETGGVLLPREIEGEGRYVYAPIWLTPRATAVAVRPALGIVQLQDMEHFEEVDYYSLISTNLYGNYTITASGASTVPLGLQRHPWAQQGAVLYEIRHSGDDFHAGEIISNCARQIAWAAEGAVTNEDGFDVTRRAW